MSGCGQGATTQLWPSVGAQWQGPYAGSHASCAPEAQGAQLRPVALLHARRQAPNVVLRQHPQQEAGLCCAGHQGTHTLGAAEAGAAGGRAGGKQMSGSAQEDRTVDLTVLPRPPGHLQLPPQLPMPENTATHRLSSACCASSSRWRLAAGRAVPSAAAPPTGRRPLLRCR